MKAHTISFGCAVALAAALSSAAFAANPYLPLWEYIPDGEPHGKKGLKLEMNLVPRGVDAKVEVWAVRPSAAEGSFLLRHRGLPVCRIFVRQVS